MNWTETGARTFPRRYPTAGPLAPRERPDWMEQRACGPKTHDLFFPGEHAGDQVVLAKRICATCPVIDPCLSYALDNRESDGVWGGLSGCEREKILKARRQTEGRMMGPGAA